MKFKIFKTIDDFFNDHDISSDYTIKFLFHKNNFEKLDINIKNNIYNIVPRKNIFFNNSYRLLKDIIIDCDLTSNMEYKMINTFILYSMKYFLKDKFGIDSRCYYPEMNKSSSYRSIFKNIDRFLCYTNIYLNGTVLTTNKISKELNAINPIMYSVRNLKNILEKESIYKYFLQHNNYSLQDGSDIKLLKGNDLVANNMTLDINPLLLLDKKDYLEFIKTLGVNFIYSNGEEIIYYIANNFTNNYTKDILDSNIKCKSPIRFKYNKNISYEKLLCLLRDCKKIHTNSIDLLCLSIIFNKPVDYYGKETLEYNNLIKLLGIEYDKDGNIKNYEDVYKRIEYHRLLAFENLKDAIYKDDFIKNNSTIFKEEKYLDGFKKEYFQESNHGIIVQNTERKISVVQDLTLLMIFNGNEKNKIETTKRAIELYRKTIKETPEEFIFIEIQSEECNLKFRYLKEFGIKYIPLISSELLSNYNSIKLSLIEYGISIAKCENVIYLNSDCIFVNDNAFLIIKQDLEKFDFIIPYMWAYSTDSYSKIKFCKIIKDNFDSSTEELYGFGITKKLYNRIPVQYKSISSTGVLDGSILVKFLTNLSVSDRLNMLLSMQAYCVKNCNFSYSKNIICHTVDTDLVSNYYVDYIFSKIFNLKINIDCELNLKIEKDDNFYIYNDIINRFKKTSLPEIKEVNNRYDLSKFISFKNSMENYIATQAYDIQKNTLFKFYGNIKEEKDLVIYLINTSNNLNYLNYLKKRWNSLLKTPHQIIIYNPNNFVTNLNLLDIFNTEKKNNCLIVNEYIVPKREFEIYNIKCGTFAKEPNTCDIIYYKGDYSSIYNCYAKDVSDFRNFCYKNYDLNNYIDCILYKNNIKTESIRKYILFQDYNYLNYFKNPDVIYISRKEYFNDLNFFKKQRIIDYDPNIDYECS